MAALLKGKHPELLHLNITIMSYFKAVFDASRPLSVKVPEEREIHSKMSTNPLFADPPVLLADYLLALDEQDVAIQNAEFGGIERTAIMRSKARVVDDMVRKLKAFVTVVSDGNTDIILSSGFRHTKPRQSMGDMPKVEGVKRFATDISGQLKLNWNLVKNVGFYEVQVRPLEDAENGKIINPESAIANADSGIDDNWVKYSSSSSRIVIDGLKPLIYHGIRVRARAPKVLARIQTYWLCW